MLLMLLLLLKCISLLIGVGKLEAPDIILVKSISLKRIDHKSCLEIVLKVCKA